ncbi:MAG TPA: aminodeoxychorismate synthase component I [Pyrinomonadaceae bacterium]|nr:aminodeoxychorismate synthase component I [Pyrinomonadaceae bacterium]
MKSPQSYARMVFDFPDSRGKPRPLCFARPVEIIEARSIEEVGPALRAVQKAVDSGFYAAGFVGYEAAPAFDRALVVREGSKAPLLWFGIFRETSPPDESEPKGEYAVTDWTPTVERSAYERNVAAARESIARGDTYQINYTFKLRARFGGDAYAFYRRLAERQGAAFCAYVDTGRFKILSASPELFFRTRGREIITRPMKGTIRRGLWLEEDETLAAWLAASEKNRAENIMITDLLRNDLGRIAETGSVSVTQLCHVERYPTVFQMTSTVEARMREGVSLEDVFAALFPCGSVTGAPKISTTRIIAALEDSPRNVYCGSVGFITPRGEAVFNVAIRTVMIDDETGEAEYGVGGGITWDSTAADEFEEALTKAMLLKAEPPEFELLETLRLERGAYSLLERHIGRLRDSARRLDFKVSEDDVRRSLQSHAGEYPNEARRVRLLVSRDGGARVESAPLDELPTGALPVALAAEPVSRSDLFLYHKTTRRGVYERRRADDAAAFDVLLWNEDGEVTEFTTGNVVAELDGELLTPPRECGLLAGTLRAELLESGAIKERVITRSQLSQCSRLWLINGVRGWAPVFLRDVGRQRDEMESA